MAPLPTGVPTATPNAGGAVAFVKQQLLLDGQPALDPVTGQALRFIIVDLTRPGVTGAYGTFEEPFGSVSAAIGGARSGDIIYVRAAGTAARVIDGFSVPAGVRVLTNGPSQTIRTKQQESVVLPLSNNKRLVRVAGTVTLGAGSSLSGFDITATAGAGIQAANATGSVEISNNIVRGGGGSGISVASSSGETELTIANNTVSNAADNGILIRSDGSARVTATLASNNASKNAGSGIFVLLNGGQVTATLQKNVTGENQGRAPQEGGIRFGVFNAARGTVTLQGNTSLGNRGNGIFVGTQGTSQATCTATGNTASGNTGNGIFLGSSEDSVANGTISGNTASSNKVNEAFAAFPTGSGIFVGSLGNGRGTASVSGNTASGNGNIGVFFFVANNGRGTASITNNAVSGNTRNGIEVNAGLNGAPGNPAAATDAPQASATIEGNRVTGNLGIGPPLGGGGVFVLGFNRSVVRVGIRNNQVQDNAKGAGSFAGMALVAVQRAQILAGVTANRFSGNGGANPAFTAASGVPDSVLGGALTGPARIALRLSGNSSDSSYALLRLPGTAFQADATGNSGGPVVQPGEPVEPLGGVAVP